MGGIRDAALFRAATFELSAYADEASAIHSSRRIRLAVTAIGQMSVLFVIRTGRLTSKRDRAEGEREEREAREATSLFVCHRDTEHTENDGILRLNCATAPQFSSCVV